MDLQTSRSISEKACRPDVPRLNHLSSPQSRGGWHFLSDKIMRQLVISKMQWHEMRDHVALHAPFEACGLLAGNKDRVEKVIFVWNQAQRPDRFVMEPYE